MVPMVPHSLATMVYDVITTECAAKLLGDDILSLPLPWYKHVLKLWLACTCRHPLLPCWRGGATHGYGWPPSYAFLYKCDVRVQKLTFCSAAQPYSWNKFDSQYWLIQAHLGLNLTLPLLQKRSGGHNKSASLRESFAIPGASCPPHGRLVRASLRWCA